MSHRLKQTPVLLPAGTQVVVLAASGVQKCGRVGVIVESPADPWHAYRVRFADGQECSLRRKEMAVLSEFQDGGEFGGELNDEPLFEHVIYRCVIGSRAYGLDDEQSDTDRRGIYLPPAELQWSLYGVPEQIEKSETQEVYWELERFLMLALKANPNVLECLFTPLVEFASPIAQRLLEIRQGFLSKLVYQTYSGYVMSQFKKLQADLRNREQAKPKHLMHLIRLLLAGIATLREGTVPVHVGEHRARLLAIRRGEIEFEEINTWRLELHREFDLAFERTNLPERPDYDQANALLLDARRSVVKWPR